MGPSSQCLNIGGRSHLVRGMFVVPRSVGLGCDLTSGSHGTGDPLQYRCLEIPWKEDNLCPRELKILLTGMSRAGFGWMQRHGFCPLSQQGLSFCSVRLSAVLGIERNLHGAHSLHGAQTRQQMVPVQSGSKNIRGGKEIWRNWVGSWIPLGF